MPNMNEINKMSDEEIAAMNKQLAKKLIINVLVMTAAKAVVFIALNRLARRFANSAENA